MRSLVIVTSLLLLAAGAVFAAQISGAKAATHVSVTLTEYRISMTSTTIPAGVPVTFTAVNKGQTMHEVVLEKAGAVDLPLEMKGGEAEIEDIAPGETKSATWTITEPGVYQLACHVRGHFEAGMVQQLTVTSATGSGDGLVNAPVRLAAPSSEDQAEHEDRPAAGGAMAMTSTTPARLPLTETAVAVPSLWWLAAILLIPIAAAGAAFFVIVRNIRPAE